MSGGSEPRYRRVVGAVVVVHFLAHTIHGLPHLTIPVHVPSLVLATVVLVVYLLPIVGAGLVWRGEEARGLGIVTLALGLSFLISGALHFVIPGPDNIASAPGTTMGVLFTTSAGALAIIDGAGVLIGLRLWMTRASRGADRVPQSGRIAGVPDTGVRPFTRALYWISRRVFGAVTEPMTILAHHRGILAGTAGFELALARAEAVDDDLRELVMLKAAAVAGCEFCLDIGTALAEEYAVPDAKLRALDSYETSEVFTNRERVALRYAEAMTRTPVEVPDELFDALAATFDERALVELTAAIAFENYRARFNTAMGIEAQGFATDATCPVPEPQARADAPSGGTAIQGDDA